MKSASFTFNNNSRSNKKVGSSKQFGNNELDDLMKHVRGSNNTNNHNGKLIDMDHIKRAKIFRNEVFIYYIFLFFC